MWHNITWYDIIWHDLTWQKKSQQIMIIINYATDFSNYHWASFHNITWHNMIWLDIGHFFNLPLHKLPWLPISFQFRLVRRRRWSSTSTRWREGSRTWCGQWLAKKFHKKMSDMIAFRHYCFQTWLFSGMIAFRHKHDADNDLRKKFHKKMSDMINFRHKDDVNNDLQKKFHKKMSGKTFQA